MWSSLTMIRISKMTDYGVVVLARLAERPPPQLVTAAELARLTGVPAPTVSKLLKKLGRAGLVGARRGPEGGYQLVGRPEAISIADVVTVLEGPISLVECGEPEGACELALGCPVKGPWQPITALVRDALNRVSLADLRSIPSASSEVAP
jgi:FeS assembly SUF system regulator